MILKCLVLMSLCCIQEGCGLLITARFFMRFSFEQSSSVMAGLSLSYVIVTYITYSAQWSREIMLYFS